MKYLISLIIHIVLSFPAYADSTVSKCKVDGVTTYQNTPIQELRDDKGEVKYNTLVKTAVNTNVVADEQKKEGDLEPLTRRL